MASNLILPFAQGAGANVLSDAGYASSDVIAQGFQSGRAASNKYNKALRQSTSVASGFGQFTADFSAVDFTDSMSPQAMRDNFRIALAASQDSARMGIDTGATPNQITFPIVPLPPALSGPRIFWFRPGATNTGATTVTILNSSGTAAFPTLPVKRKTGGDPQAGDLVAGYWYGATCDGSTLTLLTLTTSEITIIALGGGGRAAAHGRVETNTGNSTVTIYGSTNVSSIGRGSVTYSGQAMNTIIINFITPMNNANYTVLITPGLDNGPPSGSEAHVYGTPTANSFTILMMGNSSGVYQDQQTNLGFAVFQN